MDDWLLLLFKYKSKIQSLWVIIIKVDEVLMMVITNVNIKIRLFAITYSFTIQQLIKKQYSYS